MCVFITPRSLAEGLEALLLTLGYPRDLHDHPGSLEEVGPHLVEVPAPSAILGREGHRTARIY